MLLDYRNPQFWKDFQSRHWQPRVPTVLRQPFKNFPFSEDLLFRSMQRFETGLRNGDQRKHCLVSVASAEREPRRPLGQLFREKCGTLQQLERACGRVFPQMDFGLMVTNMHAVDPGIWNGVTAFLQDARQCIDFPVPRAYMDLFYGRYSSSFTGLHKDTQEIFAFVVRGEKRILAWPFHYFLSKVEDLNSGDKYANKRLTIDHRKYRKDALVLDARAGDVIYWPSEYWHVAEAKSKRFSAMLSLGILRPELALGASQSSFTRKLLRDNPHTPSALLSQDMSDVVGLPDAADAAPQLRWVTGFGFENGGPVAEDRVQTQEAVTIIKNKSSVLLWQVSPPKQLVVASGGHSITLPYSRQLLELLERIAQGESVSVPNGQRGTGQAAILETYWNKLCQPKVRKLSSRRDHGAWLAHWLLRVYAVERVSVG